MEILSSTGMVVGNTLSMPPRGHGLLAVAIEGTFILPKSGAEPRLPEQQPPLLEADTFSDEPGASAPVYESDTARRPRSPKSGRDVFPIDPIFSPDYMLWPERPQNTVILV